MLSNNEFYTIVQNDTWATISSKILGDVRLWWILVEFYNKKVTEKLELGTIIPVPTKGQILDYIGKWLK